MMRPFEMETQAEVGAQQGAAALDLAPKQGGTQTKARAYWFDRDTILQEKKYYWMVRRAQDIFFPGGADRPGHPHGHRGADHLDRQPRGKPDFLPGPGGPGRKGLQVLQVPPDGVQRRGQAERGAGPERDGRPGVQDEERPADHPGGALHLKNEHRRIAPAGQHPER